MTNPAYRREGEIEGDLARTRARMLVSDTFTYVWKRRIYFVRAYVAPTDIRKSRLKVATRREDSGVATSHVYRATRSSSSVVSSVVVVTRCLCIGGARGG